MALLPLMLMRGNASVKDMVPPTPGRKKADLRATIR
jgi:hypothetical protein